MENADSGGIGVVAIVANGARGRVDWLNAVDNRLKLTEVVLEEESRVALRADSGGRVESEAVFWGVETAAAVGQNDKSVPARLTLVLVRHVDYAVCLGAREAGHAVRLNVISLLALRALESVNDVLVAECDNGLRAGVLLEVIARQASLTLGGAVDVSFAVCDILNDHRVQTSAVGLQLVVELTVGALVDVRKVRQTAGDVLSQTGVVGQVKAAVADGTIVGVRDELGAVSDALRVAETVGRVVAGLADSAGSVVLGKLSAVGDVSEAQSVGKRVSGCAFGASAVRVSGDTIADAETQIVAEIVASCTCRANVDV